LKTVSGYFFQSHSLWVTTTVYAYARRQPFVELSNGNGASAKLSMLLDYAAVSGEQFEINVFSSLLSMMNLILAFLVTPFTAN